MRIDPGVDGDAQRLAQLVWLLFLRTADLEDARQAVAEKRPRVIPTGSRWDDWAEGALPDAEVIPHIDGVVLPTLRTLSTGTSPLAALIAGAAQDAQNAMTSGALLREVTQQLHLLDPTSDADRHVLGDVYEQLLGGLREAGNAGEFYTPRAVTGFIADALDVQPGETVLDPAFGTGGFLVSVLEKCRERHNGEPLLFGIEKKPLPHLLGLTNLILHGVVAGQTLVRGNGLLDPIGPEAGVDVIATNPPFGGSEEADVTGSFPSAFRTRETADLFVFSIVQRLRPGGRAAVVLPDGLLFGGGPRRRIRQSLLDTCSVESVVRLPGGVFSPYTDIQTNVLFFSRSGPTARVWFFEQPGPGTGKRYTRRRPIQTADFAETTAWCRDRTDLPNAWAVDVGDLTDSRLDPDNPRRRTLKATDAGPALARHTALSDEAMEASQALGGLLSDHATAAWRQLEASWHLWTGSSAGIKRLEQLILTLAAQGRLGPSAERDRDAEGGPHPIPIDWRWRTVGDLGDVLSGGTPKTDDPAAFADEGTPWLTPADLRGNRSKYVTVGRRHLTTHGLATSSAVVLPAKTVLFSSRAPIGYVAIAGCELATNQGFKSVVPKDPEDAELLYYLLRAAAPRVERDARGTTFKEVPARQMKAVLLPVPAEPDRLALTKLLDTAMASLDVLVRTHAELGKASEEACEALDAAVTG